MPAGALPHKPAPPSSSPTTSHAPAIVRHLPGLGATFTTVETPHLVEVHLTVTPVGNESPESAVKRAAQLLEKNGARAVRVIAFGKVAACATAVAALRKALNDPHLPVTWVEGAACDGHPLAGLQIHAIAGIGVEEIQWDGGAWARVWTDTTARHCVLGQLGPTELHAARPAQARETFEQLQVGLSQAGMSIKNVARTWFYLDDILAWYGDFNRVRNDFFARTEVRSGSVPASTGVSGHNPAGAALAVTAWAVQPLDLRSEVVRIVPSPKQCPAPAYGSAFSRAIEIQGAGFRQVLVSGTASIEPGGRTAHVGNVAAQIDLTMEVVEAILESRQMTFADVTRATAYFRSGADAPSFVEWLKRHNLPALPVIHACCDICRDDLLFEIEVDAVRAGQ